MATKTYMINEIFYSLQGEGARAGTANVFVRFTGCNLRCDIEPGKKSPGKFACDTEFESGRKLTAEEIYNAAFLSVVGTPRKEGSAWTLLEHCRWMILTGGEPALQVDEAFINFFHRRGIRLAIETNGTLELPRKEIFKGYKGKSDLHWYFFDWITVSPKLAEHAIKQKMAHEVKYVRGLNQAIPKTVVEAEHKFISPAFVGNSLDQKTLAWCIQLVLDNPSWALSVQQHKGWEVR